MDNEQAQLLQHTATIIEQDESSNEAAEPIKTTMKALLVTRFGDSVDDLSFVELSESAPLPPFDPTSSQLLVRVIACALNPGDVRVMTNKMKLTMGPHEFPYTPGLDLCGIITQVGANVPKQFAVGDCIVAGLRPYQRFGGMAEYVVMDASLAAHVPSSISSIEAAALPIVGATAMQALQDAGVDHTSSILILGGSGGIGTMLLQIAKHALKLSFVATTSTNQALCASLGADLVIDYRHEQWHEVLAGRELDAVIDCVGCVDAYMVCDAVLKRSGKFITLVGDHPHKTPRSVWSELAFGTKILWRSIAWPFLKRPTYTLVSCFPTGDDLVAVLAMAADQTIHAVLDPTSPYAFTQEAMEQAIRRQASARAKGKLVIRISDD